MYVHQLLEERRRSEVRCIKVGQTLLEAADVLSKYDIGSLLVLDDRDVFIGIMTERDLVYATTHFGLDTGTSLFVHGDHSAKSSSQAIQFLPLSLAS